ncbi:hypothetical protein EDC04DRAFT_2555481 [Pisolithus marmoratus]|nr:hypothetical protein EDC04DRAFT_2555481 [Pisolithus marmoratus]
MDPVIIRPDLVNETKPDAAALDTDTTTLNQAPPSNGFEARDRFSYRRGLMHHPYSHDDAPYMLAYDRPSMENDKFSEMLLQRLNPGSSPSFLKFDKEGPKSILDLGCGSGQWAIQAATYWGSARVIGFDLVYPSRLGSDIKPPENLQWKQGNFVKYKLPFPKGMFDYVRMANLSLCIPEDRWKHVLQEVRRVLTPGGHLELIDDYIHFPYAKNPPQQPTATPVTRPQSRSFSSGFDDADDEDVSLDTDESETEEDFMSTKSRFSTLVEPDPVPPDIPYDPVADWNREVENSNNLERVFENMLAQKFNVLFRPRTKIEDTLQDVFGRYNSDRVNDFRLFLAPPADKDSDKASVGSSEGGSCTSTGSIKRAKRDFVHWVTAVDRDKKDKKDKDRKKGDRSSGESVVSFTQVPENISAKAAVRLGINPSSPRHLACGQSPGIVVNMQTFIPLSPFELEMHACKHIHTLLGCKAAIHEYLEEMSKRTQLSVPEHEIDDILWDYECFRRKRFNWPAEVPEYQLDSPESDTFKSTSHRLSFDGPRRQRQLENGESSPYKPSKHSPQDLDLIRSIYVYSAQKVDDDFLLLS